MKNSDQTTQIGAIDYSDSAHAFGGEENIPAFLLRCLTTARRPTSPHCFLCQSKGFPPFPSCRSNSEPVVYSSLDFGVGFGTRAGTGSKRGSNVGSPRKIRELKLFPFIGMKYREGIHCNIIEEQQRTVPVRSIGGRTV